MYCRLIYCPFIKHSETKQNRVTSTFLYLLISVLQLLQLFCMTFTLFASPANSCATQVMPPALHTVSSACCYWLGDCLSSRLSDNTNHQPTNVRNCCWSNNPHFNQSLSSFKLCHPELASFSLWVSTNFNLFCA